MKFLGEGPDIDSWIPYSTLNRLLHRSQCLLSPPILATVIDNPDLPPRNGIALDLIEDSRERTQQESKTEAHLLWVLKQQAPHAFIPGAPKVKQEADAPLSYVLNKGAPRIRSFVSSVEATVVKQEAPYPPHNLRPRKPREKNTGATKQEIKVAPQSSRAAKLKQEAQAPKPRVLNFVRVTESKQAQVAPPPAPRHFTFRNFEGVTILQFDTKRRTPAQPTPSQPAITMSESPSTTTAITTPPPLSLPVLSNKRQLPATELKTPHKRRKLKCVAVHESSERSFPIPNGNRRLSPLQLRRAEVTVMATKRRLEYPSEDENEDCTIIDRNATLETA